LTPKCIFFHTTCNIHDRWIYHSIILILEPKFRFWALKVYFWFLIPKSIFFLTLCKITNRLICHTIILILGLNSIIGLWGAYFAFLTPRSVFFLTSCKIPDRWINIQAQSIILLFSVFKSICFFWLTQSNAFEISNQNALLLFNVCESNFLSNKKISWLTGLVDMSHDHTDFEAQILFLGSGVYFCFLTPRSIFFLTPCKFPDP
jgi:hypothetical protein